MNLPVLLALRRLRNTPTGAAVCALMLVSVLLLVLLAVDGGLTRRAARQMDRVARGSEIEYVEYWVGERPLTLLIPTEQYQPGASPLVPPPPGTMLVSPALATKLQQAAPDAAIRAHLPFTITGLLAPTALRAPDELVALVGTPDDARAASHGLPTLRVPRVMLGLVTVLVLVPTLVLLVAALRFDARRRERRLATFWMLGASPSLIRQIVMVETLLLTVPATLLAGVLLLCMRPVLARVRLGGMTFWATDLLPNLLPALLVMFALPLLAAATALFALRRIRLNAHGLVRQTTSAVVRRRRLLPLAVGICVFFASVSLSRNVPEWALVTGEILGLILILVGLVLAGPVVVRSAALNRLRSPRLSGPALLGLRRLERDAAAGFRAIVGLALIAFVFGFLSSLDLNAPQRTADARSEQIMVAAMPPVVGNVLNALSRLGSDVHIVPLTFIGELRLEGIVTTCDGLRALIGMPLDDCRPNSAFVVDTPARAGPIRVSQQVSSMEGQRVEQNFPIHGSLASTNLDPRFVFAAPEYIAIVALDDMARWEPSSITVLVDQPERQNEVIAAVTRVSPLTRVDRSADFLSTAVEAATTARVLRVVFMYTIAVGGVSLLVAIADGRLERRRAAAIAGAVGMSPSGARIQAAWEVVVPLLVAVLPSLLLGVALAVGGGTIMAGDVRVPWMDIVTALLLLAVLATIGIIGIVASAGRINILSVLRDDT